MKRQTLQRATGLAVIALAFGLGVTACAPPGADTSGAAAQKDQRQEIELQPDETAEGFDLDALVEAAKKEGPITIYDETGKVSQITEAFTAKYGIEAEGVKIETNAIDKVKREHDSGNVIADVLAISEPPAFYAELLRDDILTNWVPGDVYDKLPEEARYPYLTSGNWLWWMYNTEAYGDTCPVSNLWELTEEDWKGKVALPDPEARAMYTNIWNQSARDHADEWAKAYEDLYGEKLETDEPTAFHEWLKRLAKNASVFKSDEEVSEAVGAPGQEAPPLGQTAAAKLRNNAEKGYSMAPCAGLEPYVAGPMPQTMAYASKSKSPNAAKLYIHFATSQEGMEFIMPDGKRSYNPDVVAPEDAYGLDPLIADEAQPFSTEYLEDDYKNTVAWQDFWRSSR
ncbi:ABC transporter substrate-binding protein [Leucobacter ruminantium]|uniref:ABC transporter substrate-binding protein n=1 Tax=Leucobacter ruminantium TaxID=1289170 RepID=A0A939RVY2_9MICO|nr:ABC transporter substrate-binding protein [Leucobacter ruminantium]MBO1804412.1 ABC transporter substrate-binding protein [Leucobacter ruminantium]